MHTTATAYRQPSMDLPDLQRPTFPCEPGDLVILPGSGIQIAFCFGNGHANEAQPWVLLPTVCLEPNCGQELPRNPWTVA